MSRLQKALSNRTLCLSHLSVFIFVVLCSVALPTVKTSMVQILSIAVIFVASMFAFSLDGQIHWKLVTSYLVRTSVELKTSLERASLIQFLICADVSSLVIVIGELLYSITFCLSSWQYYPRVIFKTCTAGLVLHR